MSQLPAYATNYGNTNSNQNANQPIAYSDSVVPPPTFQQNNYQANSGYPGSSQQGNNAYAPPLSVSTNPHSTLYPSQPGFQGQPSPQPNGTPYSPQQQYQGGAYQQNNQNSYTPPCNPQSQGGYPQQGGYSQQNPPGSFQQQPPSGYPTHQDNMTPQHGGFPQQTAPPGYQGPPPGNFNGDMQENSIHTQMGLTAAQSVPSHSYPGIAPPGQSGMPSPTHDGNPSIAASFFSQAPPLDPNKQANPYVIHWNKTVGIGAGLSEQGSTPSLKGFPTYEIPLYHVNDIFHGKIQPWNTKYAQAIKIFGPGMAAKLARATIRKQHDWLYRNVGRTNETGHITNGNDLLSLLNFGRLPNGYILFYTYVIVDGIWRFSQTGKSKMKDFMSKHAAHAGCAREVTYSGEFHIQQSPQTGGYKLILDNNSGTYAPDTNDLPRLAQLFRTNFPGLEVEALHFADPVLKGYVSMVNESNLRVH